MLSNSCRVAGCDNFLSAVCGQAGRSKLPSTGLSCLIVLSCVAVSIQPNRELADEGIKGNSVVPLCPLYVTKPVRW